MSVASLISTEGFSTTGTFKYLRPSVQQSLYRNAQVLTRRDCDGSDSGTEGVHLEETDMAVRDARRLGDAQGRTLARHGFELRTCPLAHPDLDFFSHHQVVQDYYGEGSRVVQESRGATCVFAFDHNVRSAAGKGSQRRIAGGQQVQGPAHVVHGDYTLTSAPERLQALAKPPAGNDTLSSILDAGNTSSLGPLQRQRI